MTFEEFGATLRAEREKRNLGIDDVAAQLKISPRQLRALESGDIASLPHPAYARGFIRSYGTWLGMDHEQIQEAMDSMGQSSPAPCRRGHDEVIVEPPRPVKKGHGGGLVLLLLLCALAAAGWYAWKEGYFDFLRKNVAQSTSVEEKLPSADTYVAAREAERAGQKAETDRQNTDESVNASPVAPEPPAETSASRATVATPIETASGAQDLKDRAMPEASGETVKTENRTAEEPAVPADSKPGQHKLIITAIEECWVHSNADRTDTRQFSLRKGDTFALTFGNSLELKLGNAGGVRLRYDGNDLPPPGTSGQVKTLVFPPRNNQ